MFIIGKVVHQRTVQPVVIKSSNEFSWWAVSRYSNFALYVCVCVRDVCARMCMLSLLPERLKMQ